MIYSAARYQIAERRKLLDVRVRKRYRCAVSFTPVSSASQSYFAVEKAWCGRPIAALAFERNILRGHKVLLDTELAALYGVTTKRLNEQVKRNKDRFPEDFLFRLSRDETEAVNRSQIATGSQCGRDASGLCV